jgi:hypothetical protein
VKPIRTTAPETSLLNPKFKWVPSHQTDVSVTIERAKRELAKRKKQQEKRA